MTRDTSAAAPSSSSTSERTALLHDQHRHQEQPQHHHHDQHPPPTGFWPWRPHYWAAVPIIFLAGLSTGPAVAMTAPFVKELFCDRGIPKYFPGNFSSDERGGFGHSGHGTGGNDDTDRCNSAEYSAAIAKFVGINHSLSAVLITLMVRSWSSLSDRIGRKKTILIWAVGTFIAHLIPLVVYYVKDMTIYLLWVGGLIEGFVGSILCLIALTHAYVADVTSLHERIVVFGRVMAGWYAGLGLGSALGGLVVKQFGLVAAFWLMPAIIAIDIIYIMLIPESLTVAALANSNNAKADVRITESQSQATLVDPVDDSDEPQKTVAAAESRLERLKKSLLPEQLPGRLGGKHSVLLLMITCFLALLAVMGAGYQISNYLLYRFRWSTSQLSYVGAIQGLSRLVSLTVLLPFIKRFSPKTTAANPAASISFDLKVVMIGLFIEALTMFLYGATNVGEGFYIGGATGAVGSLFFPAARGILSQSVAPEMLGRILGTLATFESLAAVLAPSVGAWFYGMTLKTHPSAVFYGAFVLALAATLLVASVLGTHVREMRRRQLS
ncbi:hypothetical protein BGZ83_001349 [Gryganskiella cystojenkinii]|nr:hypothetical protein BGZ83_001349 [Gryganskiella cystojenkinii]